MNSRERIKKIFNFQVPDRIGIFDAPWPETVARWRAEGLPPDGHVNDYFQYDIDEGVLLDTALGLPEKIIETAGDYVIYSNANGVTHKAMRGQTGAPLVMDYLIKTEADWSKYSPALRYSKDRIKIYHWGEYEAVSEKNVGLAVSHDSWDITFQKYKKAREKNKYMFFVANGPFENTRNCMHAEQLYIHLIENPDFIRRIFHDFTEIIIRSYEQMARAGIAVDGFHFADDIAYKNGMLFSPQIYRELLFPFHKRLCDYFKSKGLPVMFHTDGKLDVCLPLLIEAGITAIQPIEARAGNDVRRLKELYGDRLVFVGNIDVGKLSGTRKDIEDEIRSKVLAAKEHGGYIYHSDHSVPPSVSFENYKFAMELLRQYGSYWK